MREILFRGKRKDNRRWVEGDLTHSVYKIGDTCVGTYGSEIGMHQVYSDTVGQFTGLCDRNGKRIFEGDIISCFCENLLVEWDAGAFQSSNYDKIYPLDHFTARNCEVSGNIHDNPELIGRRADNG